MTTQIDRSFRTLLLAVSIEPQEIGKRIKATRERQGWTQADFAREADVSLSSIQRWERGELPPVRELIRLAGVLGVEADALVELEPTGDERLDRLEARLEEAQGLLVRIAAAVGADPEDGQAPRRSAGQGG